MRWSKYDAAADRPVQTIKRPAWVSPCQINYLFPLKNSPYDICKVKTMTLGGEEITLLRRRIAYFAYRHGGVAPAFSGLAALSEILLFHRGPMRSGRHLRHRNKAARTPLFICRDNAKSPLQVRQCLKYSQPENLSHVEMVEWLTRSPANYPLSWE